MHPLLANPHIKLDSDTVFYSFFFTACLFQLGLRYLGRVGAGLMVVAVAIGTSHNRRTAGLIWNIDLFHLLVAAAMATIRVDLLGGSQPWFY
jgi:hypothetical protein